MGVKAFIGAKERRVRAGRTRRGRHTRPEQVKHQARRAKSVAQENPLGLAVGAVAVGFLAGMLVPSSAGRGREDGRGLRPGRRPGEADRQEALEHGKQVAQETAQSAQETLKDSAQQHGEEVKQTVHENAEQTRAQASA